MRAKCAEAAASTSARNAAAAAAAAARWRRGGGAVAARAASRSRGANPHIVLARRGLALVEVLGAGGAAEALSAGAGAAARAGLIRGVARVQLGQVAELLVRARGAVLARREHRALVEFVGCPCPAIPAPAALPVLPALSLRPALCASLLPTPPAGLAAARGQAGAAEVAGGHGLVVRRVGAVAAELARRGLALVNVGGAERAGEALKRGSKKHIRFPIRKAEAKYDRRELRIRGVTLATVAKRHVCGRFFKM